MCATTHRRQGASVTAPPPTLGTGRHARPVHAAAVRQPRVWFVGLAGTLAILSTACSSGDPAARQDYAAFDSFGPPTQEDVPLPHEWARRLPTQTGPKAGSAALDLVRFGQRVAAGEPLALGFSSSAVQTAWAALEAMREEQSAVAARDARRINDARRLLYRLGAAEALLRIGRSIPGSDRLSEEQVIRITQEGWSRAVGYYLADLDWSNAPDPTLYPHLGRLVVRVAGRAGANVAGVSATRWLEASIVREQGRFRVVRVDVGPDVRAADALAASAEAP